jgi:GT2 family glycosyltransferase
MQTDPSRPVSSLGIVLVCHNESVHLARCLGWLSHLQLTAHVVIVDNASTDETPEVLKSVPPKLLTLRTNTNLGYGGGNNYGLHILKLFSPAYYLILNPDVALSETVLPLLLRVFEENPRLGILSPDIVYRGGEKESDLMVRSLWGKKLPRPQQPREPWRVDRVPGRCMMVRASVLQQIGEFDEKFFIYWSEIDLGLRAKAAGFELAILTSVCAFCYQTAETGQPDARPHVTYYLWRDQFYFAYKHFRRLGGTLFLLRMSVHLIRYVYLIRRSRRWGLLKSLFKGLKAGVFGEAGAARVESF